MADRIVQLIDGRNNDNIYPVSINDAPIITVTNTDPGAGSSLAANHFVAVTGTQSTVGAADLSSNAVTTAKIADSAVTVSKVNFTSFPVAVPDYSNAVAFTSSSYTAPSDGFVHVRCDCSNAGSNGSCWMYIYITRNGVEYAAFRGGNYFDDPSYFHYYGDATIPVKAGDIIRPSLIGNSTSYSERNFYPAIY